MENKLVRFETLRENAEALVEKYYGHLVRVQNGNQVYLYYTKDMTYRAEGFIDLRLADGRLVTINSKFLISYEEVEIQIYNHKGLYNFYARRSIDRFQCDPIAGSYAIDSFITLELDKTKN